MTEIVPPGLADGPAPAGLVDIAAPSETADAGPALLRAAEMADGRPGFADDGPDLAGGLDIGAGPGLAAIPADAAGRSGGAVRLRLRNAAFGYLGRYATSAENLRRVLARKARRIDGLDPAAAAAIIDEVVAFCVASGLVDDAAFAAMKVSSGLRRGLSRARMAAMLSAKGVPPALARASLPAGDDLAGALRLARRRRLGPWRTRPGEDAARRDAAALARAGYPPSLARRVAAMTAEEAEEALADAD